MRASVRTLVWMPCVLMASLLLGCGRDAPPAPAVPVSVPETAPAAEAAFELLDAGAEEYQGRPALKLHFSQPLAPAQAFDSLLRVTGPGGAEESGSWVLTDDNRVLRFPYVQADRTYSVAVTADISAADGRILPAQAAREVYSGDLPPAVGFASQGSILPARETDGLPVVAVNVPEVDLEFLRVRPEHLPRFFAHYLRPQQRSYWELSEITRIAEPVYANRFVLEGSANQRRVSFIPVQTLPELSAPGLYFAVMKRPGVFNGQFEATHFYVSDLGLHARVQAGQLWVHAASLASGQARSGVEVELLDKNGSRFAVATTDNAGNTRFDYRPSTEHVLLARTGSEIALIPFRQPALDLSEFAIAGRRQTAQDVFAWSGRDLYRPGEPMQVSALLRDFDGRALPDALPLIATLRQPDGRAVSNLPLTPGEFGYYSYQRTLSEDAPTGRWTLEFRIDPEAAEPLGRFAFRIEEFLPERLKLALDSARPRLAPGEALPLQVDADYLYGAPAGGNRFTAEVIYRPASHPVAALRDYHFGDPTLDLPKEPETALDTALDDQGTLAVDLPVLGGRTDIAAPVDVLVSGSVFESGGRAVRRSLTRTVWPADVLVGVRPLFDLAEGADYGRTAGFEIVRSDAEGKLAAAGALEVKLVRERRDYHWNWVDGQGWRSDYSRRFETVQESTLALDGERAGRFEAPVEWGEYRLEIRDPDTGLVSRLPFTAGWSWNDDNRGVDARPDKVKLALDKTGYRAGDVLTVTVTSPHEGPGVLLVEAEGLLAAIDIEVREGTTIEVPVTPEWERHDVYLTAMVLRPAGGTRQTGPGRAIGVAHVPMARDDRRADVSLTAPERSRPGDRIEVQVDAPAFAGKRAFAVIEAVDLGIINLTNYAVPDAAAHFFAQRGFGVEAWDVYGRVIERLEGERARLRFGGDAAITALPQARRPTAKVQTVALHHAPVQFDAQGRATLSFEAPDFNGTLRIAALAYSEDSYGRSSAESIVRAPLVVEVSTPRVLAPGDSSQISVDLHNLSGAASRYTLRASAEAPLSVRGSEQSVELADNERRTVNLPLTALPGHGVGHFRVTVDSPAGTVERRYELVVRPAWSTVRRSRARVIESAQTLSFGANLFEGLMPSSGVAMVTVSSTPPLPFAASVKGLIGYPYGCIEQTSSRIWPLLWMDEATARKVGLDPLPETQRRDMLDSGLARIASMQLESGHFGFWPGDDSAYPQLTPYVADMLSAAQAAGHSVPQGVLDKALERLKEDLLTGGDGYWSYEYSDHLRFAAQAYSGYVLARSGRAPLGTLRALHDNERGKSITALPLLHLGLALHLQGDAARAEVAIREALAKKSERPRYLGDYGSPLRDDALILALLHEHGLATNELDARVIALAREARSSEHERWGFSTQEQIAIFRLGRALLSGNEGGLDGEFRVGDAVEPLDRRRLVAREFDLAALRRGVSLSLQGNGPFWLAEDVVGTPTAAPPQQDEPVRVRRAWYRTDGTLFEGGSLTEGDTLIAKLTIEPRESIPDALVIDLLPGGLEIENLALGDRGALGQLVLDGVTLSERRWSADIKHEEFRDDRYVAAVNLGEGAPAHLFYLIRAVSPGRFVVPPPMVEDMYRPSVRGLGASIPASVEVKSP